MRLLFICEAVFPEYKGGLERWFQILTRSISNENEVIYLNASGINEVRDGVKYISIVEQKWEYSPVSVRSIRFSIEFARKLYQYLKQNNYDGIYCAQAPILSIFSCAVANLTKRKVLIIEWFEIWPLNYWIRYLGVPFGCIGWCVQMAACQFGDILTVFTPRAKSALAKLRLGRARKITILDGLIPQNIDFKEIKNERNDIIFLGRLVEEKQPILALEAVALYAQSGWNGNFWLIGQGPLGDYLQKLVSESPIMQNVRVILNATDETVLAKMQTSFLLVHPSRREGYGISIVEAAAHGVPALLIDYPDNASIDLGINPCLVSKSDSPHVISRLIEYAHENQKSLSQESREWIRRAAVEQTMTRSADRVNRMFQKFLSVSKDRKDARGL